MYVRLVTFTGVKDLKAGTEFIGAEVLPTLREQKGYGGATVSASKADGVLGVLSLWETEAAREASFAALAVTREKAGEIIGGQMSVESFEQLVVDIKEPPVPGSALTVTRFNMEPAAVEDHLAFFKSEVLPGIASTPGYRALRNMVNRDSGEGLLGVVWKDEAARDAASAGGAERRKLAVARGIRFGDITSRELVLADLP